MQIFANGRQHITSFSAEPHVKPVLTDSPFDGIAHHVNETGFGIELRDALWYTRKNRDSRVCGYLILRLLVHFRPRRKVLSTSPAPVPELFPSRKTLVPFPST